MKHRWEYELRILSSPIPLVSNAMFGNGCKTPVVPLHKCINNKIPKSLMNRLRSSSGDQEDHPISGHDPITISHVQGPQGTKVIPPICQKLYWRHYRDPFVISHTTNIYSSEHQLISLHILKAFIILVCGTYTKLLISLLLWQLKYHVDLT